MFQLSHTMSAKVRSAVQKKMAPLINTATVMATEITNNTPGAWASANGEPSKAQRKLSTSNAS